MATQVAEEAKGDDQELLELKGEIEKVQEKIEEVQKKIEKAEHEGKSEAYVLALLADKTALQNEKNILLNERVSAKKKADGHGHGWPDDWDQRLEAAIKVKFSASALEALLSTSRSSINDFFTSEDAKLVAASKRILVRAAMRIALRVKTQTRKVAESKDPSTLIDGPVEGVHGQDNVEFAWVWKFSKWNIGKVGPTSMISAEYDKIVRATSHWTTPALMCDTTHVELDGDKDMLVMPFLGHPLSELLLTHPDGLPLELVFDTVICTIAALVTLAHHGFSHNDIKPSNLTGSTHVSKLLTLIDLGSVSEWKSQEMPATTPGYGGGMASNSPLYDLNCLAQVAQEFLGGATQVRLLQLLREWKLPETQVHSALWKLAEDVASLAKTLGIAVVQLDFVKPTKRQ